MSLPRTYSSCKSFVSILGGESCILRKPSVLISCRLPKADSALLGSSLFHHLCRFALFRRVD
jgi:hypothetical protein